MGKQRKLKQLRLFVHNETPIAIYHLYENPWIGID